MNSNLFTAFVVLSILGFLGVCIEAHEPTYRYHVCSNTNSFTPNSSYQYNLNILLSLMIFNAKIGFQYFTIADNSTAELVYGSFLCRGDLTPELCQESVTIAAIDGVQRYCPSGKIAIIWYDECMLRYTNEPFYGRMDESPGKSYNSENISLSKKKNSENISDPTRFTQLLADVLVTRASNVPSGTKKYVATEAKFTGFPTLYCLAQCTPDLSSASCDTCLRGAIAQLPVCCTGGVLYPSCNVRYEIYSFYTTEAATPSPPPEPLSTLPPSPPGGKKIWLIKIIVSVSAACLALALFGLCVFFARKRRNRQGTNNIRAQEYPKMTTVESLQFDLGTIEAATKKFSGDNKLGEGGFGQVFKGTLDNGQEIAVKRLSKSSGQGVREFKNEVLLVSKLQHRNLVRLLGSCLEGEETLLVYEYVPNKSLDFFLFEAEKREQLDWSRRCTIIGGIARGILYLHEDSRLRVIHRDLKASNILLDANMHPKISDFGMARMFGIDDQTQGNTRRIVGTYGYMAPEYAMEGLYSIKSDVFSFGILLLEILTGRKNFLGFHPTTSAPTLLSYAWQLWNEGKVMESMDPLLKDSCSPNEFLRYIHIGLLCVQEDANKRPTMSSVVLMLKSESISLSKPERPAFFTGRSINNDHEHTLGDIPGSSVNGLTVSDDIPR